jgi:DNA-binding response OmpR family regulator
MDMKTVLVIDDAEEVRKALRFHLEKKYVVLEAATGEKGLAMILEKHPNLVILDINLPKMTGIELYSRISSEGGRPSVPVIILTIREELGKLFKGLNVDGFIAKPFDVENVLREIDMVMKKRYDIPIPKIEPAKPVQGIKKILVVDDDPVTLDKIAACFIKAGYALRSAPTVLVAFERIMTELPDLIAIKLKLPDLSGDMVCMKLKQMPKTMNIPLFLYMPPNLSFDRDAVENICRVIDVKLIETTDPEFLLNTVKRMLAIQEKGRLQNKGGSSGGT